MVAAGSLKAEQHETKSSSTKRSDRGRGGRAEGSNSEMLACAGHVRAKYASICYCRSECEFLSFLKHPFELPEAPSKHEYTIVDDSGKIT